MQVRSLGWEGHLEKEMAGHCSILAWKIPWTVESGGLQSMGSQTVRHDWGHARTCLNVPGESQARKILASSFLIPGSLTTPSPNPAPTRFISSSKENITKTVPLMACNTAARWVIPQWDLNFFSQTRIRGFWVKVCQAQRDPATAVWGGRLHLAAATLLEGWLRMRKVSLPFAVCRPKLCGLKASGSARRPQAKISGLDFWTQMGRLSLWWKIHKVEWMGFCLFLSLEY